MTASPLSQRLQEANDELQLSTRGVVDAARKGGYEISTYTAARVLSGKHGNVKPSTLEALSYVFRVPYDELAQLAGQAPRRGFELPPDRQADAETLTRSQVALISEMIRHLAEGNRQYVYRKHGTIYREPDLPLNHKREAADEEVASDDDSTPMNQAAGSAATEDPDDYDLAADDSLHQGAHGQIGPDDIEHST